MNKETNYTFPPGKTWFDLSLDGRFEYARFLFNNGQDLVTSNSIFILGALLNHRKYEAHYYVALIAYDKGNIERCVKLLEDAIINQPDLAMAKEALERIGKGKHPLSSRE
jgi:hypothetical protein